MARGRRPARICRSDTHHEQTAKWRMNLTRDLRPRLLYLVSEDWYFLSHRLPMARAARDAGYEVHVATRVVDGGAAIEAEGFALYPLHWRRGSTNPFDFLSAVAEVRRAYRSIAPDLVHQVAFWPS